MDGAYYREKAERCRLLSAIATVPEVKEQLRLWTYEFDDLADAADKRHRRLQHLRSWRKRMRQAFGTAAA